MYPRHARLAYIGYLVQESRLAAPETIKSAAFLYGRETVAPVPMHILRATITAVAAEYDRLA